MSEIRVQDIPVENIDAGKNFRRQLNKIHVQRIAHSVREAGFKTPVEVVPTSAGRYQLCEGFHRLEAARLIGLKFIPAVVHGSLLPEAERLEHQLLVNSVRATTCPMDLARGIASLVQETGWTGANIAQRLAISEATLARTCGLLRLHEQIQRLVEEGRLAVNTAYQISCEKDPERQLVLAKVAMGEGLTRDAVAAKVRQKPLAPKADATEKCVRARAVLGNGHAVTISGPGLTLETLITTLEAILTRARKARPQGIDLTSFTRMLREATR